MDMILNQNTHGKTCALLKTVFRPVYPYLCDFMVFCKRCASERHLDVRVM